jgi:hypothetical protein
MATTPEDIRLAEDVTRGRYWKRFGPYLSERQWGTVREDYSADQNGWTYFTHEQARSRAYRWGEDGLLGISDRQARLCFALALWNENDPILKERLYGLSSPEGNHGEDVKELYYYLDGTPTASYLKALYKYPHERFPYEQLVRENDSRKRDLKLPEYEITDTGVFDRGYFDVLAEYAKKDTDDIFIRITLTNRGDKAAPLHVLPTLWFRNTWSWGRSGEGYPPKPTLRLKDPRHISASHDELGEYKLTIEERCEALFTDNESNVAKLFGAAQITPYVKDAFHRYIIDGAHDAVNPAHTGTKSAWHWRATLQPGETRVIRLNLSLGTASTFADCDETFNKRIAEADAFYATRTPPKQTESESAVVRQAYAGLIWSKQFYTYIIKEWVEGDPAQPPPPEGHVYGRNRDWQHVFMRDVLSMPDKWEYPWFAAWDLAFHMIPFAKIDPQFAKDQLVLLLREWYMHPNGQIPAYEYGFADVNPPVHAWSCWQVYKLTGRRDHLFLSRVFNKLLVNFTWWVNRKDAQGRHLFDGGFLGLDNIGVFDRSQPLPSGVTLEQADGTAWMAFFCAIMLAIALELAVNDPAYEDIASKLFEHFIAIVDAINRFGGSGLWDDADGFYYTVLDVSGVRTPMRVRSATGVVPLFAARILDDAQLDRFPGFKKRMRWFLENRKDLAGQIAFVDKDGDGRGQRLLAIPSRERLVRTLKYVLDENELLSPYGMRALSKIHAKEPFVFNAGSTIYRLGYEPGDSQSYTFGGNSNWRGPVWFPLNILLIEALERYHRFYGDSLQVEMPTGSGVMMNLHQVARALQARLGSIFLPDKTGRRPCHGGDQRYATDPAFKDLVLFYEYFHGDDGRGLGASHQTGWTALVARCLEDIAADR